jgi:3-phenylpropionate/trans-cinnamate dioxygenase ferredoxin component
MSDWKDVCKLEKLVPGDWEMADLEDTEVAVFNLDGKLYAIEDLCTHDGGYITGGRVDGDQITCPRHNARFSVRNGACITAHAYEPISTYPVRVKDGMIQVMNQQQD